MPILPTSAYDQAYFDAKAAGRRQSGGYAEYVRKNFHNGNEMFRQRAETIFDEHSLFGKKVLELGCAKGFIVEDLRDLGVDAYGIDVSPYAIGQASPSVAPYLTVGDVRTALAQYDDNEFDEVFSLAFLVCIPEADLPSLVTEMNRIAPEQFHEIYIYNSNPCYTAKPFSFWQSLPWATGTKLFTPNKNISVVV